MSCDHREGRRLQPHGVSEPELQGGVLLGVPGTLGATWLCLVSYGIFMKALSSYQAISCIFFIYFLLQINVTWKC